MRKIIISQTVESLLSESVSHSATPVIYDYLCDLLLRGVLRVCITVVRLDSGAVVYDYQPGKEVH